MEQMCFFAGETVFFFHRVTSTRRLETNRTKAERIDWGCTLAWWFRYAAVRSFSLPCPSVLIVKSWCVHAFGITTTFLYKGQPTCQNSLKLVYFDQYLTIYLIQSHPCTYLYSYILWWDHGLFISLQLSIEESSKSCLTITANGKA